MSILLDVPTIRDALLMLCAHDDRLCAIDVLLDFSLDVMANRPQLGAGVGCPKHVDRAHDPRQAFAQHDRRVVDRVQRVPQLVAGDVDKLFLQPPVPVRLHHACALGFDGFLLEPAEARDVEPDAEPTQDLA
jgi:hypothetical protein